MVVVPKLQRKLLRDLKTAKMQFGAVALIIVLGVALFIASYVAYQNLDTSYEHVYDQLNMADYWISVDYIDQRAARQMDEIPGTAARGRIVGGVFLELDREFTGRVEGRVISLPSDGHPLINDIVINSGRYFSSNSGREVLLEKHFADYHNFKPGDWITIKRENRKARFQVAGIVMSPEYIWVSKSAQEPMATPRTFGILFMPQSEAETLFAMKGLFTEINLSVEPDADRSEVLSEVKGILRKHHIERVASKNEPVAVSTRKSDITQGVRTAYIVERKDQPSHQLLKQDLDSFRQLAVLFPSLFISMAALTIYVLLNRLVGAQRVQIGLMRALGYGKPAVLLHYLGFALTVGIVGSLLGIGLGYILANLMTVAYAAELKIPTVVTETRWDAIALGMVIGIAVPLASGLLPAWATVKLHPAESMRPPNPTSGHRTIVERLLPFLNRLPHILKLPLRNIFRNPRRSFFMAMGVASATSLILLTMSFVDGLESILLNQFERVHNYDARVIFQGTGGEVTASRINRMEGVNQAEAILEAPYRVRYGERVADIGIMGLPVQSSMYRLFTPENYPAAVVEGGILLPLSLKEKLNVNLGNRIQMEPLMGTVGETEQQVAGFVQEAFGGRAYMTLEDVQKMLDSPEAATSVLLRFNGEPSGRVLQRLYNLPQTASIEFVSETSELMDESMGFFWVFVSVMFAMGAALGLAIVFNSVMVNVLERRREIALMRAIGTSFVRLALLLTLENLAICFLGIIMGLVFGYYLAVYFWMAASETDMFSMSAVIYLRSYIVAAAFALVILLISQVPAIRQVYQLNLSTATKDWSE
ncbi:ABC transporter permease [Chloroflexota bacterium]